MIASPLKLALKSLPSCVSGQSFEHPRKPERIVLPGKTVNVKVDGVASAAASLVAVQSGTIFKGLVARAACVISHGGRVEFLAEKRTNKMS